MRVRSITVVVLSALLALIGACNFPVPTPTAQQVAATETAQAAVPVTGGTGTPTTTPTTTTLSVSTATPCRSGPEAAYGVVATLNPGSAFIIVGKYTAGNFWVIANPAGGTCWVFGRNAIVAGNTDRLPEFPAPPLPASTPTLTAVPAGPVPPAPTGLSGSRFCARGMNGKTLIWREDVVLTWQSGTGELGYRIFRDNQPVLTVDTPTADFQFTYNRNAGVSSDTFSVEAYNNFGASPRSSVYVPRCP